MENEKLIFYLTLSDKLPRNYFSFEKEVRKQGFTAIPVTYSTLLGLTTEARNLTVVCIVSNNQELVRYLKRVRKILKFLVQNHTIDLYLLSSFTQINETGFFRKNSYYYFEQLPVNTSSFCYKLTKTIHEKNSLKTQWPGGKSPRPSMLNSL